MTLSELQAIIYDDLDLADENFIDEDEITANINKAYRKAKRIIESVYEDYFLDKHEFSLVASTSDYDLPTDCFVNKIRRVVYDYNSIYYDIPRIMNLSEVAQYTNNTTTEYRYMLVNPSTSAVIRLYSTPSVNETNAITVWYTRDIADLSVSSDEQQIPEADDFILVLAKYYCLQKDLGNPMRAELKQESKEEAMDLYSMFSNRTPDDQDGYIRPDTSFYEDFDLWV